MTKNWQKSSGLSARVCANLREAIILGQILQGSLEYGFNETTVKCLKKLRGKNELYLKAVARTVSKRMSNRDSVFISIT